MLKRYYVKGGAGIKSPISFHLDYMRSLASGFHFKIKMFLSRLSQKVETLPVSQVESNKIIGSWTDLLLPGVL